MLADVGRLDEAIEHMGRAVGDARALFGPSSTMVGFFSGRLSQYQQAKGELRLALESAHEHLSILGKLAEPDSFTHLSARHRYAMALLAARRGEQALGQLATVAEGFRRVRGPESEWVSGTEVARALALAYVGRVKEARGEAGRLLEALRSRPGASLGRALHVAGVTQRLDGDARAALRSQEESLAAIKPGPRADLERLPVLTEIGLDHVALGNHDEATRVLGEALALFATVERRMTPTHADALVGLGRARLAQGRPADALAPLEKADRFWREFDAGSRWANEAALWLGRVSRPRLADGRVQR
jgi:tetratricopeptide (TPR) repeat protein